MQLRRPDPVAPSTEVPVALHELVVEMGSTPLPEVGSAEHLAWVCTQGRRALGADGVAVLVVGADGSPRLAAASDPVTAAESTDVDRAGRATRVLDLRDATGVVVGALHVRGTHDDAAAGSRAVADVLGAGLAAARTFRDATAMVNRLTSALAERAPVEQAKGVLAERYQCDVGAAFAMIRAQARRQRVSVRCAAQAVLAADEPLAAVRG